MKQFWDNRYAENAYAYGIKPNNFIKNTLDNLAPSSILFPADGEGRNGVYAATQGWQVTAFDYSEQAKIKALELAKQHNVIVDYHLSSALEFQPKQPFDAIGLTFAHFPPDMMELFHQSLWNWLKPNGIVILEGFHKKQLPLTSGGPKNLAMLFDEAMLKEHFSQFDIEFIEQKTYDLDEGQYHQGQAEVIRMIARKVL